jgi:hypothetical protein
MREIAFDGAGSLPDARGAGLPSASAIPPRRRGVPMSKGMDQKKQEKKKPTKTLKEKRAEKAAKKGK